MLGIKKHYNRVRDELAIDWDVDRPMLPSHVHAIVCISKVHKPTMRALAYARASRPTYLEAVTVDVDPDETQALLDEWDKRDIPVPLKVLASPYRQITKPILDYVRSIRSGNPRDLVTVYLPEYVLGRWWEQVLHNQSALRLKARLLFTPGVMVVSVPWQLQSSEGAERDWIDEPPIPRLGARRGAVSQRRTRERPADRGERAPAGAESLVGREWTVDVGPVAHGGHCVARHEGQVVFVRHTLPGERVVARVTEGRVGDSFLRADAVRCSRPRPVGSGRRARMPPPGCAVAATSSTLPSTRSGRSRRPSSGSSSRGSPVSTSRSRCVRCPVTTTGCAGAPASSSPSTTWAGRGCVGTGLAPSCRSTTASSPRAVSSTSGVLDTDWPDVESVDVIDAAHPDEPVLVPLPVAPGADPAGGLVGELAREGDWEGEYVVAARGFWQVHPGAASTFLTRVVDAPRSRARRPRRSTSMPGRGSSRCASASSSPRTASSSGSRVTHGPSRTASANTEHLDNVEWRANRVDRELRSLVAQGVRADLVVLDPPRTGAGKDVMGLLARLGPRRVVYVACDPAALARDVKAAGTQATRLVSLEAWDAFPMTHHVECIAVLEPRGESTRPQA